MAKHASYQQELQVRIATPRERRMKTVGYVKYPAPLEYQYAGDVYCLAHTNSYQRYAIYVLAEILKRGF